jgi:uncharacterized protein (TIGR03437 family)
MAGLLAAVADGATVPRLAYSTFLNGTNSFVTIGNLTNLPRAIADPAGNTYIAFTNYSEYQIPNSANDVFTYDTSVLKISADGKTVAFTTPLQVQIATGLAVDTAGNIYVVGGLTPGAGFIAKLAPDGSILYTHGISALPLAVAADAAGAVYVTGTAEANFQTTPGAYKTGIGPAACTDPNSGAAVACSDAFVLKMSPDGASVLFATFLGGAANDSGLAIAVDQSGSAVVAGQTFSSDFPLTAGAFQPVYGGAGDGFMARLDPTGRTLSYATFIGGSQQDSATDVVLDANGNAYLTGVTASPDFPVTPGAFQTAYGGDGDTFFVKLGPLGQAAFSSYLGGATPDTSGGIAIGPGGRFYVAVEDFAYPAPGTFVLQLDSSPVTPCSSSIAIVAIDAVSGNVVDHYALRRFGYDDVSSASISVDGSGLVHVAGWTGTGPFGNSFAVTPDALANLGSAFLARVNFSGTEEFAPACLVNAASYDNLDVSVAPGEIVSLFGKGLGPPNGLIAQPGSDGSYPRQLGGTQILLGGVPIPLLYVSDSQVNAVVPYSLNSGIPASGTDLTIEQGTYSASYALLEVWPAWPALFTQGGWSGSGQIAAINQDGSINGPANPAPVGSVVSLYATGLGSLNAAWSDDVITPLSPPWPGLAQDFGVYIAATTPGGAGMQVLYAGPAPGLAPGAYQVNVVVPSAAVSGQAAIRIAVGGASFAPWTSDYGPYVWVQAR